MDRLVQPSQPVPIDRGNGEELEWEAEEVVDSRLKYKKIYYKVRWRGEEVSEQPWFDLLPGCEDLVTDFHTRHPHKVGPPAQSHAANGRPTATVLQSVHKTTQRQPEVIDLTQPERHNCSRVSAPVEDVRLARPHLTKPRPEPPPPKIAPVLNQDAAILRLPQEILEHVLSYLPRSGLKEILQLGATCKELRARTEKIVGTQYFSDRTFLLSDKRSMEALLHISKHPMFSRTMKCIRLALAKVVDTSARASCRGSRQLTHQERVDRYARIKRRQHPSEQEKERYSRQVRDCQQLLEEQRAFLKGQGCSHTLQSILANFKAAGNIPALTTSSSTTLDPHRDNSNHQGRGVGFARLRKILWRYGRSAWPETFYENRIDTADHRHLKIIHEAICKTRYPITRFELGCGGLAKMPIKLDKLRSVNSPFVNLKILNLTFKPMRSVEQSEKKLKAITDYVLAVLTAAKYLKTLKLALSSPHPTDRSSFSIFQAIVRRMTSNNKHCILNDIQDLHLHRFGYHFEDVLTFLSATRSSMKRLQITNEPIREMGESPFGPPWKEMVLQAKGSNHLELLGHIWTDDPKMDQWSRYRRRERSRVLQLM